MRKPGSKVEGFGGIMAGAAFINVDNPDNNTGNSATKFAWGLKAGVNIWASEKMAIKLQGQLMSAVQGAGGGLYFGTGGGGAGVSTYSSMLQFGLGGGLSFALGGAKKTTTPQ
jgi:opacity protein-like surface antigen